MKIYPSFGDSIQLVIDITEIVVRTATNNHNDQAEEKVNSRSLARDEE